MSDLKPYKRGGNVEEWCLHLSKFLQENVWFDRLVSGRVVMRNEINTIISNNALTRLTNIISGGNKVIDPTKLTPVYYYAQDSFVINSWVMLADVSGSIKVDIWKTTYALHPPTNSDSITGGNEPSLSSAIKGSSASLGGWSTTNVTAGDVLAFNVDSCTTIKWCCLVIDITKVA